MLPEHADVLVVGGGPAGLAAAIELKRLGVREVVVADREPEAGGVPRLCHHPGFGWGDLRRLLSGPGYAAHYRRLAQSAGVQIHTATTITRWSGSGLVAHTSPQGLGEVAARAVLLATGCRERPRSARLVPGHRPQGIFTTGSLQRFLYEQHLPVGKRAVIVGAELVSLSALLSLWEAHIPVAAIVNEAPQHQIYFPYLPMKWLLADLVTHTPIYMRAKVTNILGRQRVEGVEITQLDSGQVETIACDTVIFTGDWIPEHELARLGGLTMDTGTRGPQVDAAFHTSQRGVFAAGNLLRGAETADWSALEGRRAAQAIHEFLRTETWPEHPLPIQVAEPLAWVYPNVITSREGLKDGFGFRSHQFCDNVRLEVRQGERLLHTQPFTRLIVNETMRLHGEWLSQVDLRGEPLHLSIANP